MKQGAGARGVVEGPSRATEEATAGTGILEVRVTVAPGGGPGAAHKCYVIGRGTHLVDRLDEEGRAVFEVALDEEGSFEVVVSPGSGSSNLAAEPLADGTEGPSSSAEVLLRPGERTSVELQVLRGAELRVAFVDGEGALAELVNFYHLVAEDGEWGQPELLNSGDGSRWIRGLTPGWHLIAPAPGAPRSFPPTSVELTLAQTQELRLQLRDTHRVPIDLRVVGEDTGEPVSLPVDVYFERDDSIARLLPSKRPPMSFPTGTRRPETEFKGLLPPTALQADLSPGKYWVTVKRASGLRERYITADFDACLPLEITADGNVAEPVVVRAPEATVVAVMELSLSQPLPPPKAQGKAHSRISAWTRDEAGVERETPIWFGGSEPPRLWIDPGMCTSDVEFVQVQGGRRAVLQSVPLRPGTQRVELTPRTFD